MKKFVIFLLVCLMLTACGGQQEETTPETETTAPPVVGLYDPENPIETATNGAVRAYPLESSEDVVLLTMGDKLVLATENKLTVLQGDLCQIVAELDVKVDYDCISASETGIAYFDAEGKQIVLLNPLLQQSTTYALPDKLQGKPMINLSTQQAFYCYEQELRALNLQTGISRLIRTFTEDQLMLKGIYFNGAVLMCDASAGGNFRRMYLSTENGKILSEDVNLYILETYGDQYLGKRMDGSVGQMIVGIRDADFKSLNLDPLTGENSVAALPLNGVVTSASNETGIELAFYDIQSGRKTAAVSLKDVLRYVTFHADNRYVWVVGAENDVKYILYRWDTSLSPVTEDTVYTGPLYTRESPDTEGLKQLQDRVDAMNKTYGLRIAIWEDAGKKTGDHTVLTEYQTQPITKALDDLEPLLGAFPEKFLQTTVKAGWIRISLVRSIDSGADFAQFWHGGDCYGTISVGADVKTAFLRCAAYAIDAHVMGNSRDFDTWKDLNPSGFTYGEIPKENPYLEGEKRAFVDEESMVNPHEDRSRIIAYAMMEGNAEMFASETMQAKLLRVCEGIREAYGLEKSTEIYLWEQYLNQSLAYTK